MATVDQTNLTTQWTTTWQPAVFGGLDFSGAKEPLSNLWTALGIPDPDGRLRILDLRPHAFRQDAMDWIQGGCQSILPETSRNKPALWGFDFPLALPQAAATAMWPQLPANDWHAVVQAVCQSLPKELNELAKPHAQTKRLCDGGAAMAPLNLRLIRQTHEGLRLIDGLQRDADLCVWPMDQEQDQDQTPLGQPGPLTAIEVYPSQTAKDLGLRGRKPARPGDGTARPAQLSPHLVFDHPAMAATCGHLEDAWDAVLACLTAFLVRDDLNQAARLAQTEGHAAAEAAKLASVEGWIHRHPAAWEL